MKRHLLFFASVCVALLLAACSDDEKESGNGDNNNNGGNDGNTEESIVISLNVSNIANNQATINVTLSQGQFYGAMLVEAVNRDYVTIDLSSEIQIINYVRENGVEVNLPYTNTITDLRADTDMFSAAIALDSDGYAVSATYQIWTSVGAPDSWSDDNSAGNLEGEIDWN